MKILKIGILVESFPRISQTWLDNQLIDLKNRGHELRIFAIYKSPDSIVHQAVLNSQLLDHTQYFFNSKSSRIKQILEAISFSMSNIRNISFAKLIKGVNAILKGEVKLLFGFNYIFLRGMDDLDIFHAHFGEMGVFGAKMKKVGLLKKAKLIVSFHGHDIFPFKKDEYKIEYKIFENHSDALLVNSEYSESLLSEIITFPNVRIIPVGLNLNYFRTKINSTFKHKIQLLFLGRLVYLKGGLLMIEIFRRLLVRNPDLELIMIGDGEQKEKIISKVIDYRLGNSVLIKGSLSQNEIIEELDSSSIYVYPGLIDPYFKAGDTQCLVVQEAQSMELPVVCSDVGGVKYGLIEEETGFLVKEGDIDGFVERIQYLIDHPEERIKMGKAGRSFVKQKFDSKVIGDQLERLYYEVLQPN